MTYDDLVALTRKTASPGLTTDGRLLNGLLGLTGEFGEVIDLVKKHTMQGHGIDIYDLTREGGDVYWYAAYLLDTVETTLGEVLQFVTLPRINWPTLETLPRIDWPVLDWAAFDLTIWYSAVPTSLGVYTLHPTEENKYTFLVHFSNFLAAFADFLGRWRITPDDCWAALAIKLEQRYEDGFSTEASIARKDVQQ